MEALIVPLHELMHPAFRWLARGAKLTRGFVIKKMGEPPLLVHYPMERDEALASGLSTRSVQDLGYEEIFSSAPDHASAYTRLFLSLIQDLGISGPVAFSGDLPVHLYIDVVASLEALGVEVRRTAGEDIVALARKSKDPHEIEAITSVGERTEKVVEKVREILREAAPDGNVVSYRGRALRLGDLKAVVSEEIVRAGMVEDHETILSQGRDAGVPHSRGDAAALLRSSSPIVLDIFPRDQNSGYFFDTTRTFCVGPVPDALRILHADVYEAFRRAADAVTAGTLASGYQNLVCTFFEEKGYPTSRSNPGTLEGYVHGLGHGVGLALHERPSFSLLPSNIDTVECGDVLTIEPGLYYPDQDLGVRIEDTLVIGDDGRPRSLCTGAYSLTP